MTKQRKVSPRKKYLQHQAPENRWPRFINWWNGRRVGILLALLAISAAVLGQLYQRELTGQSNPILDFYANISAELGSIAITVLIIDTLAQRRADNQLKAQLISELRSGDNGIAQRALTELRERGWAMDGSLRHVYLIRANLKQAFFRDVDLTGAWFREANLRNTYWKRANLQDATLVGADLTGARRLSTAQLTKAYMLLGATLPNGQRYDGRFNLPKDIANGEKRGFNMSQPVEAAQFYGVSLQAYQTGQTRGLIENPKPKADDIYHKEDWLKPYIGTPPPTNENTSPTTSLLESYPTQPLPIATAILLFVGLLYQYVRWYQKG